jgi:hypothetical protein
VSLNEKTVLFLPAGFVISLRDDVVLLQVDHVAARRSTLDSEGMV